jgi:hypothetical protein
MAPSNNRLQRTRRKRRAAEAGRLGGKDVDRSMFGKVRLLLFRCPRCKTLRTYWLRERHTWNPRYLCEGCGFIFVPTNLGLLGIGYGVVMGLLAGFLGSGPIYEFYLTTRIPLTWVVLGVCLIAFPVSYFVWAILIAPFVHFKYVGRVDT